MGKLKSRKFLLPVLTGLLTGFNDAFSLGLSSQTVLTICGLVATYVIGESLADAFGGKK